MYSMHSLKDKDVKYIFVVDGAPQHMQGIDPLLETKKWKWVRQNLSDERLEISFCQSEFQLKEEYSFGNIQQMVKGKPGLCQYHF